ncbi:MAG: WecB/TagA/CpsF family glycosyltransferase [Microcystaceae cyanobacterium]
MLNSPKTATVLKLPLHLLPSYTDWLVERIEEGNGTHVVTLNAEMAILAEKEPEVANIIKKAELVVPDGAGVVIYLRLRKYKQKRCPGIELAASVMEKVGQQGTSVAFYGGKPEIMDAAVKSWQKKIPNLSLIASHGYLSAEEQENWVKQLQDHQPRLILVGLGVPRQEFWIQQHRHLCPHATWMGVGGSFDIWSGVKNRAPKWLRENNLEWLYRLYQEPWRWRRMLVLPQFFIRSFFP